MPWADDKYPFHYHGLIDWIVLAACIWFIILMIKVGEGK